VVKIHKCIVGPKSVLQFIPADQATAMFKEEEENLKRLLLELEFPALFPELGSLQVNLKNSETNEFSGMGSGVHGEGMVSGEV